MVGYPLEKMFLVTTRKNPLLAHPLEKSSRRLWLQYGITIANAVKTISRIKRLIYLL